MKAKTAVIAAVVAAAVGTGSVYGAYQYSAMHRKPIKVMPVSNANIASWYYDDSSGQTVEGQIFTKDTQVVSLDKDYLLTKVYVQEGDTVKIGDPLMEYDMTLPELKKEMEEINKQSLEIQLKKQEKQLEKIKANPNSASVIEADEDGGDAEIEEDDDDLTQSADEQPILDQQEVMEEESTQSAPEAAEGAEDSLDLIEDEPENNVLPPAEGEQTETPGAVIDDSVADNISDEVSLLVLSIGEFRSLENRVGQDYRDGIGAVSQDDIARALRIFREELTDTPTEAAGTLTTINPDAFGNSRQIGSHLLSQQTKEALAVTFPNDASRQAERLYRSYANLLYYNMLWQMNQVNTSLTNAKMTPDTVDIATLRSMQPQIEAAVEAYYQFRQEWNTIGQVLIGNYHYTEQDVDLVYSTYYEQAVIAYAGVNQDITDATDGTLAKLASRLAYNSIVEETEPQTEVPGNVDPSGDFDGGGDFDDDGMPGLSADEIKTMIRDQELQISETKLQIREKELKIKDYARKLDGKIVKADMNGVVTAAGTVDGAGDADKFIVVGGAKGMYVRANVNEMKRDSIKEGDMITGTSYEGGGMSFTATVTEVSAYPDEQNNYSFYFGGDADNPNSSFYPVTAYIENTEGLAEGYAEVQFAASSVSAGSKLYLQNYYVRTDNRGKSYVYVAGEDGLLEKRYVKTGGSLYGSGIEIKGGLALDDLIAFPYGRGVKEGVKTVEVESVEGEDY